MRLGIDGNEANVKNRVGVSVYAFNLLHYFKKHADASTQFVIFLRESPQEDLPKENKYFHYEVVKGKFLWSQFFLPIRLYLRKDIDGFFSPAHYAPRFCPVPYIVTIHDLSYLYFPDDFTKKDLFTLRNWTRYSINNAKRIIAVSKTTKNDILKSYSIPDEKVDVVYNGYGKDFPNKQYFYKIKKLTMDKPSILYVGTLQPRKNIVTLIKAFSKFKNLYPDFELIIAGKKGWLYEKIFEEVETLGLTTNVFFTDYVSDNQLMFLYKNAFCFVLPSFYEGFGIPILEAMSFKCPVISSITSSLPEIGGDACLYFDPKNPDDLFDKLVELKKNNKLRQEMIKKGVERVKLFSWEDCAKKTLMILKTYGGKNN